ncbi:hypothetical protein [Thalassospira alkalitolerans]|uniref:hypothetical protein n=1 Tax=Thalassospira alkalitolerans TaxID=1293890 RepID=UPI003AA89B9F
MFCIGDPAWHLFHLKGIGIPRLIEDLEKLERTGIAEEKCKLIKEVLSRVISITDKASKSNWRPCASQPLHEFREIYAHWNDRYEGVSMADRVHRRERINEMREKRLRTSRNLSRRINYNKDERQGVLDGIFANEEDKNLAIEIYKELRKISDQHPDTFPILTKAVETYDRKTS